MRWQQKAIELSPGNDAAGRTYRIALERYRTGKPYHRLGVLEEWGIRKYQAVAKPGADPSVRQTSGHDLESAVTDRMNAFEALQAVDDRRQFCSDAPARVISIC